MPNVSFASGTLAVRADDRETAKKIFKALSCLIQEWGDDYSGYEILKLGEERSADVPDAECKFAFTGSWDWSYSDFLSRLGANLESLVKKQRAKGECECCDVLEHTAFSLIFNFRDTDEIMPVCRDVICAFYHEANTSLALLHRTHYFSSDVSVF